MKFHERLNKLKNVKGDTQSNIAKAIGVTPQLLSYYFNGREPNYEILCKLADYFSVSLDYLLGREFSNNEKLQEQNIELITENKQLKERLKTIKELVKGVE